VATKGFIRILRREEIIIERAGKKIARLSPRENEAPRPRGKLDFRKAAGLGKEICNYIYSHIVF
jgi:hypothetical protein